MGESGDSCVDSASGVALGHVFRPVKRDGAVTGERLGEKVVWQMLRRYAVEVAFQVLRRTICAALARNCAERLEASWSKSSCYSVTRLSKPRNDIWALGRTSRTLRMTRSDCELPDSPSTTLVIRVSTLTSV
jgi:hypothetical protein